jgi:HlyD family secretion protein
MAQQRLRWKIPLTVLLLAIAGYSLWRLWNEPLPVSVVAVAKGPLEIAIEEDGKTRIKDRYIVSSPLQGTLLRINLDPGDPVYANKTELASLQPITPPLLDAREIAQTQARKNAAEAVVQQTKSNIIRVRESLTLADKNLNRILELRKKNSVSQQEVDVAETEYRVSNAAVTVAKLAEHIANFELEQANAALMHIESDMPEKQPSAFVIRSPIDGSVLRVFQESKAVVQPGLPLLEVGDPQALEIETDVLSTDAVKISEGNQVLIERWGGEKPLHGIVRRVEPSAFTKISSLGVEEQRVNVIIDISEPPAERPTLGDAFQVDTKIIYWKTDECLLVPASALFRTGTTWSVFKYERGRAVRTEVQIGQRNRDQAEVLEGLKEGDVVVNYPEDKIQDGLLVAPNKP